MTDLEQRYNAALTQAKRFFMGEADVQQAAKRLAKQLEDLEIPYAICGGLAVAAHGHVRLTQNVDVLLTEDGLRRFKAECLGRGWVERFPGSRGMRNTQYHVPIDVLLTGGFPGDGKPKGVTFPDPGSASEAAGTTRVLALDRLLELKLASGMTAPDRPRDLDDVIQLIRANSLPGDHAQRLQESVRAKFEELWRYAQIHRDDE